MVRIDRRTAMPSAAGPESTGAGGAVKREACLRFAGELRA
jgi:hypothetical protein